MTPVISPWVFYLMPVCENFAFLAFMLTVAGVGTLFILAMWFGIDAQFAKEETVKCMRKVGKTVIILTVIFAVVSCLIPTEETLTKMIVAQNVTVERVDMVSDTVVTVYNDIMALFQESGATSG